jgi:hypothetical protein
MTNKLKSILAVALLVAAFVFGAVLGWHIKPGADKPEAAEPAKVTINPTTKEIKKADVAITAKSQGRLSGTKKLPTVATAVKDKPPDPVRPESAGQTISAPVEVTVPVSGTITARYNDAKTGAQIGEDTRQLTGETTVRVTDDTIKVDTKFDDTVTFAVDMPEPKVKTWHVGIYYDDGWAGYAQKDIPIFKNVSGFVRVERDKDWSYKAGLEFRF